jgi:hypothetical protein
MCFKLPFKHICRSESEARSSPTRTHHSHKKFFKRHFLSFLNNGIKTFTKIGNAVVCEGYAQIIIFQKKITIDTLN